MEEFPPLLPAGLHRMSLPELRELCVERFDESTNRSKLMNRLEDILAVLTRARVVGEVWINGSFLTEKPAPGDIDLVVCAKARDCEELPEVREAVEWASARERQFTHSCDAYKWVEYYLGHPNFAESLLERNYWLEIFGTSRSGEPKGIVVIELTIVV